jgi:hypothetical protein
MTGIVLLLQSIEREVIGKLIIYESKEGWGRLKKRTGWTWKAESA